MLNWNTYLPRLILSSLLFKIFWRPVRIKSPCGKVFVESLEPRVLLKSRRVNRREHHKYKSRLDTLTNRFLNYDIYLSLSVIIPHNNWNNIDDSEKLNRNRSFGHRHRMHGAPNQNLTSNFEAIRNINIFNSPKAHRSLIADNYTY